MRLPVLLVPSALVLALATACGSGGSTPAPAAAAPASPLADRAATLCSSFTSMGARDELTTDAYLDELERTAGYVARDTGTTPSRADLERAVAEACPRVASKLVTWRSAANAADHAPAQALGSSEETQDAAAAPVGTGDAVYVLTVRSKGQGIVDSDEDVAALGRAVCERLREGVDVEVFGRALIAKGVTPTNAGVFIGAAPAAYCPEQEARVLEYFRS